MRSGLFGHVGELGNCRRGAAPGGTGERQGAQGIGQYLDTVRTGVARGPGRGNEAGQVKRAFAAQPTSPASVQQVASSEGVFAPFTA